MTFATYEAYRYSGSETLGHVPAHWKVTPVKYIANIVNGYPFDSKLFDTAAGFPLVRIRDINESVSQMFYRGEFVEAAAITASDLLVGMDGDFNVGRWKGESRALLNQRVCCVRGISELITQYLEYALVLPLKTINDLTYSTTVKHLSSGQIEKLLVTMPSDDLEISAIVLALNKETAKIDALISEQEKLLTLLAEKRQATVSHVVTKGLNPNSPMKDSGVEWLGDVPGHWLVKPLKFLVREAISGPYGASLTKSMYSSSGYRVYGQQQVIPDDFSIGDYYISAEKFSEMNRYQVSAKDILISVMGTIGRAALVPENVEPGIINPRLVLYRAREEIIHSRYLQEFINNPTSQAYFSLAAQGTTMQGLNMTSIGALYVPTPPPDEQLRILEFIDVETKKVRGLAAEVMRGIDLLKERRSALISAAVTGKIDVRQAVQQEQSTMQEAA
jgi:type I restriction enzyme S subunit